MNKQEDFSKVKSVHHDVVHDKVTSDATDLVLNGETMLQQKTPYCTAVQVIKPRQLKIVKEMVLSEVELEPESCYYLWNVKDKHSPTGEKEVCGPTIGLEMSIARNFGNCAIDIEIQERSDSYIFIPAFLDLESGFTFRRAFRQNRTQYLGSKYDPERAEDMRFQIGQSKAIRNVIRNATPKALSNIAIEKARDLVRNHITADGIEKTRENVILAFKLLNISTEQLAEYTQISDPAKWNIDVLERLITIGKAIKNGDTSIEEIFSFDTITKKDSPAGSPATVPEPEPGKTPPPEDKKQKKEKKDHLSFDWIPPAEELNKQQKLGV